MKEIINILLSTINGVVYHDLMKEEMKKEAEKYNLWTSHLKIGEMVVNEKGMGFILKTPYNVWVSPELKPKKGLVAYKYKKTKRGLVATKIMPISEREAAKYIFIDIYSKVKRVVEEKEEFTTIKNNIGKILLKIYFSYMEKMEIGHYNYNGEESYSLCLHKGVNFNLFELYFEENQLKIFYKEELIGKINIKELSKVNKKIYDDFLNEINIKYNILEEKSKIKHQWGHTFPAEKNISNAEKEKIAKALLSL